jgi:DNA-binding CsgD family transcriptional regulator
MTRGPRICHPAKVRTAVNRDAPDASAVITLFDLDCAMAAAVTELWSADDPRIPVARVGQSTVDRLGELGLVDERPDGPALLPLAAAIEAGWRHREREADRLVRERRDEALAQGRHFRALAADMGAEVTHLRPDDEDRWFCDLAARARHVVNAVPPLRAESVRPGARFADGNGEMMRRARSSQVTIVDNYDSDRLGQVAQREHAVATVRILRGSTLAEGRVVLRTAVVDDEVTLIPSEVLYGSGITVIRSERFARFARQYVMRQARSVVLLDTPEVEPLELSVLRLLAAGAKDDTIARQLQVSDRTIRRVIAGLMDQFTAESRFQLGLRAARSGLI